MSLQPAEASWSSLPEPLAARILQSAFYDSGRALSQRARMSLVCRHAQAKNQIATPPCTQFGQLPAQ